MIEFFKILERKIFLFFYFLYWKKQIQNWLLYDFVLQSYNNLKYQHFFIKYIDIQLYSSLALVSFRLVLYVSIFLFLYQKLISKTLTLEY